MNAIPESEQRYLDAAGGWLELGNFNEAMEELDRIAPTLRSHPDVLELRTEIFLRAKRWDDALTIAETLVTQCPDRLSGWLHRSEALNSLGKHSEAFQKLCPALGTELWRRSEVKYWLAIHACQEGQFRASFAMLEGAFDVADSPPDLKVKALEDTLLAPLWKKIGEL